METPEEFLKHYHNNLPNDWLYEKREVVARLIKEYTEQSLRIHDVIKSCCPKCYGLGEIQIDTDNRHTCKKCCGTGQTVL